MAVIDVSQESGASRTVGLIPTGWFPNSVGLNADGQSMYVANGKSVPSPNPGNCSYPINSRTALITAAPSNASSN